MHLVRRKSAIDRAKRLDRIERARRMTPEERLLACANVSRVIVELHEVGKRYREEHSQNPRS
jgi:hypothetical protein